MPAEGPRATQERREVSPSCGIGIRLGLENMAETVGPHPGELPPRARAETGGALPADDGYRGRVRAERNREALEYYRARSRRPGVAEGGKERNFYCMECEGVIPHDHGRGNCPHCGAEIDPRVRRYFNWVELDTPPEGDAGPILRLAAFVVAIAVGAALFAWWLLTRGLG